MEEKPIVRCQSCGRELVDGMKGREADEQFSAEYCKFCYMLGIWTMPDMTMEDMIDMATEDGLVNAAQIVPQLKRWRSI